MPILAAAGTFLASSAGATLAATAVGAGASIYAANKGAKAAKQASNQAAQAAQQEVELQREARDEARQIFTPYSQEGASARRMINGAMGVGDDVAGGRAAYDQGFDASPYQRDAQYGAEQALNALRSTNGALGRGSSINSGKALRAAQDIQTGYRGAATQNYLSSLSGIADMGLTADSGIASGGQAYANNSGNALRNAAALQGQYGLAGAQAYANAASDISGFAGYALGNYMDNRRRTSQPTVITTTRRPSSSLPRVRANLPGYGYGGGG